MVTPLMAAWRTTPFSGNASLISPPPFVCFPPPSCLFPQAPWHTFLLPAQGLGAYNCCGSTWWGCKPGLPLWLLASHKGQPVPRWEQSWTQGLSGLGSSLPCWQAPSYPSSSTGQASRTESFRLDWSPKPEGNKSWVLIGHFSHLSYLVSISLSIPQPQSSMPTGAA